MVPMTRPTLSVVVCTQDRPRELARCLAALTGADERVVVGNRRAPGPEREIALANDARFVHEPRPGLSRARNAGAAAATAEVVAFLDDDAMPDAGWAAAIRSGFADPSLSAAAGRVLGLTRPAGEDLGPQPHRFDRSTPQWFERACFGGIGLGLNMAVRRAVMAEGQRFAEWLGLGTPIPGGEEHYLFFELIRDGHSVAYLPGAVARHDDPQGAAQARRERRIAEASAAYALGLLVREPGFRRATLRYAASGLSGRRRSWRAPAGQAAAGPSRAALLAAAARAPVRYAAAAAISRSRISPTVRSQEKARAWSTAREPELASASASEIADIQSDGSLPLT
jgi:hypothetical protein